MCISDAFVKTVLHAMRQLRPSNFIPANYHHAAEYRSLESLFSQISAVFDAFIDAFYGIVFLSWANYAIFS